MSRRFKSRLLIAACGLVLILLAGRVTWMGASLLCEARELRAELHSTPPAMAGIDPRQLVRWEEKRAKRLAAAAERQRTGIMLLAMGAALAAGWSFAAYLLWNSPRIAASPAAPETAGSAITPPCDCGSARTDS